MLEVLRRPVESALASGIGMVNQTLRVAVEPIPDRLFQGVEGQVGA